MKDNELKNKTISGFFWKFGEDGISKIINFVISIILARLLLPEDYGLIALVSVFITICDKIVVSGFATALIQKKDADGVDFSTVFYFSFVTSVILYILLFLAAPYIADFYMAFDKELLVPVIRVMGIQIVLTAISSVQSAYVSRTMQFEKFFWSNSVGIAVSAIVGIYMAYAGYGVWALVAQYLIKASVGMTLLWFTSGWRIERTFSVARFKALYSYGWKIFSASMIKVLYNDLRSLVIGKFFSADVLAFYSKGQSFPQLIEGSVCGTIDSVFFPAVSKKQSSKEDMLKMLRRTISVSSYLLTPMLFGLAAVGPSLITVLLTEKWLPCVFYLQVISIAFITTPLEIENLQAIKAVGRSDIVLKLEIAKRIIGIALLIVAIPFGVEAIAISFLISNIISAILNSIPSAKLFEYSLFQQLTDIIPGVIISAIMFAIVYIVGYINLSPIWKLVVQICAGITSYALVSLIFKIESFNYILNTIKSFFNKREKQQ